MKRRGLPVHHWKQMAFMDRIKLLNSLSEASGRRSNDWDNKNVAELAKIENYHTLPIDLRSALLGAVTRSGFSMGQYLNHTREL